MKCIIRQISFEKVLPFSNEAKREDVLFTNPECSKWYGAFIDDNLISFFCLVIKNKKAKFKSNYTVPEFRRKGIMNAFIKLALKICSEEHLVEMSAICTPLSLNSHLRNGATITNKRGRFTHVKYYF